MSADSADIEAPAARSSNSRHLQDKEEARYKLRSGEWSAEPKDGKFTSDAWRRFLQIVETESKNYTGFVICKHCELIKKFSKCAGKLEFTVNNQWLIKPHTEITFAVFKTAEPQ